MTRIFFDQLRLTGGALLLLLALNACSGERVVYLGHDTTRTVRLRETIRGAKVWVKDSSGVAIPGTADLLEGGFYRNDLAK